MRCQTTLSNKHLRACDSNTGSVSEPKGVWIGRFWKVLDMVQYNRYTELLNILLTIL